MADPYVLDRNVIESVRLDAQHLLWTMHQGHVLHPDIPIRDDMKIAELGTGTAVWLLDLSRSVPPSVQLHGFDISDKQFPSRSLWPANVTLSLLDSKGRLPPSLVGQYDVVHIRMWMAILHTTEVDEFIGEVKKMLRPKGYIYWEEADIANTRTSLGPEKTFQQEIQALCKIVGMNQDWVRTLPTYFQRQNLKIIEAKQIDFKGYTSQLCKNTHLLAFEQMIQGIKRKMMSGQVETGRSVAKCEDSLTKLLSRFNDGLVYNWVPVSVLGQLQS
ncbi:hypothetical protein XA68_11848 [Ophiocordyceps unilateralis]|uniref:Methyltransferase domain-containing protein n=1 Tax=Ophiocordyceps unilateralis TaxID=268505 RepID=A0A2A9PG23_OPHUN|nr:hypothetical protein XA68_11848 [Ophiocordyceps unilateralis]